VTELPYTNADIRSALAEVSGDTAFAHSFFDRHVFGRDVVDYAALLARVGVAVRPANAGTASFGNAFLQTQDSRVVIANYTSPGSPWYEAGLDRGAVITSLDGKPVTSPDVVSAVATAHRPGDTVPITFEVRGQTIESTITLAEDDRLEVVTYETAGLPLTPEMRRLRADWLASRAVN
jgi:predicted metalloprotease with PDZ domain